MNCNSFYETKGYDNVIAVDENFKILSENANLLSEKYKDVKIVIIDYYLGDSKHNIEKHSSRGYQGKFRLLLLLPLFAKNPSVLPELNNVELIDSQTFINLMGFKEDLREEFLEKTGLAKLAIFDMNARLELRKEAVYSRRIIKTKFNFKEESFMKYLEDNNILFVLD